MLIEKENHEYNTAQQGNIHIKIGNIDKKKVIITDEPH